MDFYDIILFIWKLRYKESSVSLGYFGIRCYGGVRSRRDLLGVIFMKYKGERK